jgi:hypothetical protein
VCGHGMNARTDFWQNPAPKLGNHGNLYLWGLGDGGSGVTASMAELCTNQELAAALLASHG